MRVVGINFVRRGAGEPLVLIHGLGHRWQAWLPVLHRLATRHEVIAVDLPGFGASPIPAAGMPKDMAAYVDLLAAFFATAELDHPHVAGYSLGGGMALELAAAGHVRSATAIAPVGFFSRAERLRAVVILRAMRTTSFLPDPMIHSLLRLNLVRRTAYAPLVAYPSRIDPILAAQDALALRRGRGFNSAVRASRSYHYRGRPAVPVAVAWGTRDRLLLPCQADRARALLPDARHVALPDCGHVPMTDNPDLVATLIEQTTSATRTGGAGSVREPVREDRAVAGNICPHNGGENHSGEN